jgi:hypothetical protein
MRIRVTVLPLLVAGALAVVPGLAQTPAPAAAPTPPGLVFAGLVGGTNPATQTITVPLRRR